MANLENNSTQVVALLTTDKAVAVGGINLIGLVEYRGETGVNHCRLAESLQTAVEQHATIGAKPLFFCEVQSGDVGGQAYLEELDDIDH